MTPRPWMILAILAAAVLLSWSRQAQERRLAFVVGNADYRRIDRLETLAQDARLVADTLRRADFSTVLATNLDQHALRRQFRDFVKRVDDAGGDAVALIYLAGYAILSDGANVFLPVDASVKRFDASVKRSEDAGTQGLSMDDVLNALADTPARLRIVLMDGARAIQGLDEEPCGAPGLGAVLLPKRAIVALSAQPGAMVVDADRNSAFAAAFAKYMDAPGLQIEESLRQIRCEVYHATKNQQIPWITSTFIGNFVPVQWWWGRAPEDACEPIEDRERRRRQNWQRSLWQSWPAPSPSPPFSSPPWRIIP